MKKKLLFWALLCTISLFSQTNVVPNGGLESWANSTTLNNWTVANSVSQYTILSAEGLSSAKLSIVSNSFKPEIKVQVPMVAGITYTVKFKFKYISNNYNGSHPIALNISKDGAANTISSSYFASNNEWSQKQLTFTADKTLSYDMSFSMFTFDSVGFEVLIDDVQVYDQSIVAYTVIPDAAFEQALISNSLDSGPIDGKVITANISSVTDLIISYGSITNLTGIQDFSALQNLYCQYNDIVTIDMSKNVALKKLYCAGNKITNLDLSKNSNLQIVSCSGNKLSSLNLKNGNNANLSTSSTFKNNSSLSCIQVDDVSYSTTNWATLKDATASYSTSCSLGIDEKAFENLLIYPNPVINTLHIDNLLLDNVKLYDVAGKLVKSNSFNGFTATNTVDLSGIGSGIYYIYLQSNGLTTVRKIVVE